MKEDRYNRIIILNISNLYKCSILRKHSKIAHLFAHFSQHICLMPKIAVYKSSYLVNCSAGNTVKLTTTEAFYLQKGKVYYNTQLIRKCSH